MFEVAGLPIYLIGIGGCGMSGMARMLRARGAIVSGSDLARSDATDHLVAEGIPVTFDQSTPWLPDRCGLVVASAAVRPDHPHVLEAQQRNVPVMTYAEALGRCMLGRSGVAVAGTHGKSTTTAMLGAALVDAGLDPTVIVGATAAQLVRGSLGATPADAPTGFRLGSAAIPAGAWQGRPGVLVAEACEFARSFHELHPVLACISSVEADHLDVYADLHAIIESFHEFAALLPSAAVGGTLVIAHDGAHRREVTAGLTCNVETIGFNPAADWVVTYDGEARRVALARGREQVGEWHMTLPGAHNAINAATAYVLALRVGADARTLERSLSAFRGVDRRMQFLGERPVGAGLVRVYDDYGHHPTEIETTLRALREHERPERRGGRLICVFQPHQHSRTRHLLEEFAASFSQADLVIVPEIYFVRDSAEEKHKVTAGDLVDRLRSRGVRAMHVHPLEAIVEQLQAICQPNDLVIAMGAGSVWKVAHGFLAGAARPAGA